MYTLTSLSEIVSTTKGFEVLEEKISPSSNWKSLKIRGLFQRAEARNQNGRVYPHSVLEKALEECKDSLDSRNMFGELDHPNDQNPTVSLKNVSHVITNLSFSGNDLLGEAIVFDDPGPAGTPAGRILGSLIRNNCTVGISSRGLGAVSKAREYDVVEEYKLVTFDCVHDPSTQKAYVSPVLESADIRKRMAEEREAREELANYIRTILFKGKV